MKLAHVIHDFFQHCSHRRASYRTFSLPLLLLALLAAPAANSAVMPQDSTHQSLGVVNCASSMCHGAISPWKDSHILHNEYSTWLRLDKHAEAYNVLLGDDSKRIARKLGLAKPASQEKICLDCHAHNPAPEKRGERFSLSDGVSCEGCHGPAEQWIKTHTKATATHASNLRDGLYPTDRPVEVAKLCLSCHLGNEKKLVTHRLMGAGHPRLAFDLDTFSAIQPPHYRIDKDWQERKGDYDGVRLWAIGQAMAVRTQLATLADPVQGRDGLFPELVVFDCHACHHPMSDKKWQPRQGTGPGHIRLNDSNLLMLRNIVRVVNPARAAALSAQIQRLHKSIAGETGMQGSDPLAEARKLSAMVDEQIVFFEKRHFSGADLHAILRQLIDEGLANGYTDYAGAEQAFMAIASVANYLQKTGDPGVARDINLRLAAMRKTLSNDEHYQPAQFKAELQKLRLVIAGSAARAQ
ncbi:MAG: multiheme c-type cytochrome [bacterium]|nr:multiheme c-type cytochrome [bacterium]